MASVEDVDAADGEADGDQQTARDHKRDHVGHAGHQVLVETGAGGGLLSLGLLDLIVIGAADLSAQHFGLFNRGAHQRRTVVNGRLGAGFMEALAGETGFVHLGVGGDDHQISGGDVLRRQGVFRPDRTLGFPP